MDINSIYLLILSSISSRFLLLDKGYQYSTEYAVAFLKCTNQQQIGVHFRVMGGNTVGQFRHTQTMLSETS